MSRITIVYISLHTNCPASNQSNVSNLIVSDSYEIAQYVAQWVYVCVCMSEADTRYIDVSLRKCMCFVPLSFSEKRGKTVKFL